MFWANFWILTLSETHFPPSHLKKKKKSGAATGPIIPIFHEKVMLYTNPSIEISLLASSLLVYLSFV